MTPNQASIEILSIGDDVVTTRQVKAARALLAWSQSDLAEKSHVSEPTIARLESADGELGGRADTIEKIRRALEKAGAEFTNGKRPGVRMRQGKGTQ
jgi:predicted transcriptional regulator